ncbi:MAG: aminomethyltransferase beta-barrel domain-containing protein, partial [Planctomycetaceae bacterium]
YVLFGIRRQLLSSVMFPLGGYEKPEIRKLAADSGLRVADKKDSYEICFVPDNDYAGFLKRHREFSGTSGNFTDLEGNILGTHDGFERFTVGQRKGLGIAFGEPRFVIRIVPETCDVVLGKREDLQVSTFQAVDLNWLADPPDQDHEILVQVRYRHDAVPCRIESSVEDGGSVIVTPEQPVYGVAPGQAAVFYRGTRVLGGGWIRSAAVL